MDFNRNQQQNERDNSIPTLMPFIKDFIVFALKKWWIFFILCFLGGLAGFFYAKNQNPVFKSRLTFALDEGGSKGIGGLASLASQFGLSSSGSNDVFAGDNILQILKSRTIIERVLLSVDTFNNKTYTLIDYYLFKTSKNAPSVYFAGLHSRKNFTSKHDSTLKKVYQFFLADCITAERPDRKLNIFEVNVKTSDEKLTKVFTSRLVDEANRFYTELRTKKTKETLTILENRVSSMKGNLSASISEKASVQDVNLNPAFASALVPAAKQQVNIQVYSVAYSEMFKNLEIARFQYLNDIPLLQIIDDAVYPMEKIKLGKLKAAIIGSAICFFLVVFVLWVFRVIKYMKRTPAI
ncbi:MAG TPA: hypothetical protein PK504_00365 [Ferruginibacter sp.]|nr:hypothetical protein [Ferruginibacter sp.]